MPSPRRKRSRSRSKEEFKYPATTSKELKALLLQYMHSEKFNCPLDSITLMRNLRMQFKTPLGRMMMKNFNINDLLQELEDKKALKIEPFSLGTSKCSMIISVSRDIVQQLCRESTKDRPKKMPSSVGDLNEKFPWSILAKPNPLEYIISTPKAEPITFSIKGTIKDVKNSDLILLNLVENNISPKNIQEIKAEDWQNEGVLIVRDTSTIKHKKILQKWGYTTLGTIETIKARKNYLKRNLWSSFTYEELLVGSKSAEFNLPALIEFENEQELYKEILRVFRSSRPVELFSKIGKDNWILVDNSN